MTKQEAFRYAIFILENELQARVNFGEDDADLVGEAIEVLKKALEVEV